MAEKGAASLAVACGFCCFLIYLYAGWVWILFVAEVCVFEVGGAGGRESALL